MDNRILVAAACDAQQVQAQQATEPELLEAVAWQGRWLDQSDDAEGWSEWRAIDTIDLPRWQKRVTNKPGCYEIRALYTTAKMHDHFQAGVRVGMAQQSQDAKRLDWVESQGNGTGWLARNSITNRGYRIHNDKDAKHKTVREAIDSAMQGDSQ